tara:strand:+ start:335 stop:748 length:414 start_codon:yes stop_codon:yes gene_type:complete
MSVAYTYTNTQTGQDATSKPIAVQWRGAEAWQADARSPAFPDKYKTNKTSQKEKNTAVHFDMSVGTGDLGSIYGDALTVTDLVAGTKTGKTGGVGGASYTPGSFDNIDWAKWAPVAVGGVVIAFLLYQFTKGGKNAS